MRQAGRVFEEMLVTQAQAGDRAALAEIAALRGPRLLAHAMRLLGDRELARDVVQEAWVDILRGLPKLREPVAFPAWATRIVTRRVARQIQTQIAARDLMREAAVEMSAEVSEAGPDAADARAIRVAIAALPSDHAATVALFYLEDMSVAEVAIALDIPVGTVKSRLVHARAKLKEALKGEEDE
ncbi:RNA polymerase sigma factor [Fontisubflavum oceani]|uniref:RNA polymerase sigma factor n=1 Tax=Fontisubflavum oceani TaxID=2978973 RepID=UPI0025B4236E|nr:RNA polymerase sigma factor [Fontisubflavum oceani]WJY21408.1 RNA polymerase sigma factor [Fontisubflavum oceani]